MEGEGIVLKTWRREESGKGKGWLAAGGGGRATFRVGLG